MDKGGWEQDSAPVYFEKYVKKVVQALKDYVSLWCTINEPNGYAVEGFIQGLFPPGKQDLNTGFTVMVNLLRAHAAAYHAIHQIQPQARVGISHYYRSLKPSRGWFLPDRWVTRLLGHLNVAFPNGATDGVMRFLWMRKPVREARNTQDFLGIDYYTRDYVNFSLMRMSELFSRRHFREGAELSTTGYLANEPSGVFEAVKWGKGYGLPIIITENGIEDADDHLRPRYLVEHLHQVWKAVNFNWPIKAYFHWTLVDNFEWERGWTQRFGLWELDSDSQARHKRPSADLYAEICRENGISDEMVRKYATELIPELFPE
ncbi:MAG: glycoside hydrolase family 1 protein [Anaerolineae bacterium]|nr:glycoside hydrolase family 1 protein [Anaerolineae bacterium]